MTEWTPSENVLNNVKRIKDALIEKNHQSKNRKTKVTEAKCADDKTAISIPGAHVDHK